MTPSKSEFFRYILLCHPDSQEKEAVAEGPYANVYYTQVVYIMANYNNLFFFYHTHYYINKLGDDDDGGETPTVHQQNATTEYISCLPFPEHDNNTTRAGPHNMVCCSMLESRGRLARANPQTRRRYDPFPGGVASYLFVHRILWADPSYL